MRGCMQELRGRTDACLTGSRGNRRDGRSVTFLRGEARGDRENQREGRANRADHHRFVRFLSGHRDRFFGQFAIGVLKDVPA